MIRAEKEKDCDAVYNVNERAFETSAEAKLVDILRAQADPVISLVCEENLEIVGHISCFLLLSCPDILNLN